LTFQFISEQPQGIQWTSEEANNTELGFSYLGVDQKYWVSHCTAAKAMWEQWTHYTNFPWSNKLAWILWINNLNMKNGETIAYIQKRFTHHINLLNALDNLVSKGERHQRSKWSYHTRYHYTIWQAIRTWRRAHVFGKA